MRRLLLGLLLAMGLAATAYAQGTQPIAGIAAGAVSYAYNSLASDNSTLIKGSPGNVYQVIAVNTTGTIYYLKFYDKKTAPTCGTDTVKFIAAIPFGQSSSGGGFSIQIPVGVSFFTGLGFCITANAAFNDDTSAATGITLDVIYK